MANYRMTKKENVKIIADIARELRDDRGREAGYAMKAARRFVRLFYPVKNCVVKVNRNRAL